MDCTDFQSALSRFMDHETDAAEGAALACHRDECRRCRETLEAHQALEALMADIPALSPPALRTLPLPSKRSTDDEPAHDHGDRVDGAIPRPFPNRRSTGDESANDQGDRVDGAIPLPLPHRRPTGDESAHDHGDRVDGAIPRPLPILRRANWLVTARACAAALAVVALFLLGRATLPKGEDRAFRPPASTAPAALATVREVSLGDSTLRVTVEGEGTRLLACRVEDGPGRAVEVDCGRDPEPGTIPSGGVK